MEGKDSVPPDSDQAQAVLGPGLGISGDAAGAARLVSRPFLCSPGHVPLPTAARCCPALQRGTRAQWLCFTVCEQTICSADTPYEVCMHMQRAGAWHPHQRCWSSVTTNPVSVRTALKPQQDKIIRKKSL